MTDLEITQLCAEAMGWTFVPAGKLIDYGWRTDHYEQDGKTVQWAHSYDPLHDDAQAMALVKKFRLRLWYDASGLWSSFAWNHNSTATTNKDLNRVICEYVAKMQKVKK